MLWGDDVSGGGEEDAAVTFGVSGGGEGAAVTFGGSGGEPNMGTDCGVALVY
jgi:hypothetical protein